MKHVKKFESFKQNQTEPVNEELIGELIKAAKGAFKNFLTGIAAPFKSLKDDFKKGYKLEQTKTKFVQTLDVLLKTATDNIQKAKDENEITSMVDGFVKQIAEKEVEFEKESKSIKESTINEGAGGTPEPGEIPGNKVQNAMIAGKVMFGIVRDEYQKLKMEFDKRYAAAKDLAAKKQVAIQNLKKLIEESKKRISDTKNITQGVEKFKQENKIGGDTKGLSPEILKSYGATKAEDLVGKDVRYKTKAYDPSKKPEDQKENIGTLKVLKTTPDGLFLDGKEADFEKKFDEILPTDSGGQNEEKVKTVLTRLKGNEDKMGKVATYAEFVEKEENKDKVAEIDKIIGTQPTA